MTHVDRWTMTKWTMTKWTVAKWITHWARLRLSLTLLLGGLLCHALFGNYLVVGVCQLEGWSEHRSLAAEPETSTPAATKPTAEQLEHFEKKIRPVLVERCQSCHSVAAKAAGKLKGGLLVDGRAGLLAGGDSGPAVVPGQPERSLLLTALRYDELQMPPAGKLPADVIRDFEIWIADGAADPREEGAAVRRPAIDISAGRQHWCYQPPQFHRAPQIPDVTQAVSSIERFILARQTSAGLNATGRDTTPLAPREQLLRRLSFDLVGLPPTPADVAEFLADDAPDATARRIDRLLASPRYGERWGRHWLDVARFAESLTLRGFIMPEAWRYRDYVIRSFNRDLPYDAFIQQQIAGDYAARELEAGGDIEQLQQLRVATTYLVLGNTNLEEQDKKQLRMDFVDEQLDTIGKGILAQTLGCARCHDHKFDPIPTREYYAQAGILRSSRALEHANVSKWLEFPLPVSPELQQQLQQHEQALGAVRERIKKTKDQLKLLAGDGGKGAGDGAIVAVDKLPGIVLDDAQAKKVGAWKDSTSTNRYIGAGYIHDLDQDKGNKTLTFQPELPFAGMYEVRFAYTPGGNRAPAVPVTVFSADGEQTVKVNEQVAPPIDGRFISLGQFRFEPNGQGFVLVSNEGTKGHVIADAVQFLPQGEAGVLWAKKQEAAAKAVASNSPDTAKAADEPQRKQAIAQHEAQLKRDEAELKELTARGPVRPMYMSVEEEKGAEVGDTRVHIRGVVHNLGDVVPRGFLQVAAVDATPQIAAGQSGRRELAQWIASPNNPLTARVFVNRTWHWLFGAGLVRTTDNFGTTGELPSHPELLDRLAVDFMARDWSVKQLIRELVLSRTYQLAEESSPDSRERDPDNRLWTHANRKRLDAETLLDTLLFLGGNLREEFGGATIKPGTAADYGYQHESRRRAVYWPVLRNALPDFLEAFDGADPSMVVGRRSQSTVAPQALVLMNHPLVREQARRTALQLGLIENSAMPDEAAIELAYRTVLGRAPLVGETRAALPFIQGSGPAASLTRDERWTLFFHVLFASV
ncbi:MAG: DUF1553 domain-containing protein, partial [Planctomycetota bacterium]